MHYYYLLCYYHRGEYSRGGSRISAVSRADEIQKFTRHSAEALHLATDLYRFPLFEEEANLSGPRETGAGEIEEILSRTI